MFSLPFSQLELDFEEITDALERCRQTISGRGPRRIEPFYVNIVVLNKDEIVEGVVAEKVPYGVFGVAQAAAAGLAKRAMTESKVAEKVASGLAEKLPAQLTEMGISAEVSTRYIGGPLAVMEVEIMDVDAVSAIALSKGEDASQAFVNIVNGLKLLGVEHKGAAIQEKIKEGARTGMMSKLVTVLPEKLQEMAGARVSVSCLSPAEHAPWFLEWLAAHPKQRS